MKSSSGFSIVELVVALFISSIIALAATKLFSIETKFTQNFQRRELLEMKLEYLCTLIDRHMEDSSNLLALQTIKPSSSISNTSRRLDIKPGTVALSFLKLNLNTYFRISAPQSSSFCKFSNREVSDSPPTNKYLLFNIDGYSLANGKIKNIKRNSRSCPNGQEVSFEITPRISIFNKYITNNFSLDKIIFILPLLDSFSIYQTINDEIRYFSEITRENQLLAEGISEFRLQQTSITDINKLNILLKAENTQQQTASKELNYLLSNPTISYLDAIL
ncbi:MAG: prepilin-type N-terminal cleavage/methylation domain-containing protein [Proteobacteria bacterium]|nr:prepilin-type N-terminal cleavage/methylation domain-containing protein [Pseudomonadota bacterium]